MRRPLPGTTELRQGHYIPETIPETLRLQESLKEKRNCLRDEEKEKQKGVSKMSVWLCSSRGQLPLKVMGMLLVRAAGLRLDDV